MINSELQHELVKILEEFFLDTQLKFLQEGAKTDDLVISIPTYIKDLFIGGMRDLYHKAQFQDHKITSYQGMRLVPSYDHSITVYHEFGQMRGYSMYKLVFSQDEKHSKVYRELAIQLSRNYRYKV